jgi:acetyltransferase-like isoleucine patch superfamily enzyme
MNRITVLSYPRILFKKTLNRVFSLLNTRKQNFDFMIEKESETSQIIVGYDFSHRKYSILRVFRCGVLEIGDRVFINSFSSINCFEKIKIGNDTIIGEGVKIYDHNHAYQFHDGIKVEKNEFTTAPVIIGKNCWIGSNVTILKGVIIGDNVIIGAGCLIHKSIPSNTIVKLNQHLRFENKF